MPRPISYAVFCLKKKIHLVPDGFKRESLEPLLEYPVRKRAYVILNDAASFICYVNRFRFFFFSCFGDHRDLHSFPTRRSSDLLVSWFGLTLPLLNAADWFR